MTEEVKEVLEPVVETKEEGNEPPKHTALEERAIEQGWRPKDEWDGDESEFRSAREFIDRGELLRKISSQGDELRKLKEVAGALSEHNKQVYVAGYKKAITDLRAAK